MYYTDRLMLRILDVEADKAIILQILNDVDWLWAIGGGPPLPSSREDTKKWIERVQGRDKTYPFFALCEKPEPSHGPESLGPDEDVFVKDGKARYPLIGVLSINPAHLREVNPTAVSVGIALDKEHQGRGYGTEALRWTMDFLFSSLNMRRCELQVHETNTAALKCYENLGFAHDGRIRESSFRDGKWTDVLLMSMLQREWLQNHK